MPKSKLGSSAHKAAARGLVSAGFGGGGPGRETHYYIPARPQPYFLG